MVAGRCLRSSHEEGLDSLSGEAKEKSRELHEKIYIPLLAQYRQRFGLPLCVSNKDPSAMHRLAGQQCCLCVLRCEEFSTAQMLGLLALINWLASMNAEEPTVPRALCHTRCG